VLRTTIPGRNFSSATKGPLGPNANWSERYAGPGGYIQFAHEIRELAALQVPRRPYPTACADLGMLCRESAPWEKSLLGQGTTALLPEWRPEAIGNKTRARPWRGGAAGYLGRFPMGCWAPDDLAPLCDPGLVTEGLAPSLFGWTSLGT